MPRFVATVVRFAWEAGFPDEDFKGPLDTKVIATRRFTQSSTMSGELKG